MAEESYEEKTEEPSEKRRREAREKGTVAKSTEVNSVLVLLAGISMLYLLGPWMFDEFRGVFRLTYDYIGHPPTTVRTFVELMTVGVVLLGRLILPVVLAIMGVGVLANYVQIGFLFTGKPLVPSFDKINPLAGFKRMFSMRSLVELGKSVFKLSVIATIAFLSIRGEFERFLTLTNVSAGAIFLILVQTAFLIVMRIAIALIILAILDYLYQRYEHEKKLKMTKQEVKEERKQLEGDPQIKSRIRALQREMARRRMMEEVPKATVVVTNPTYIAIALRYEPEGMEAPVVVAKGKRLIADRIRSMAADHDIPIVEDKPLARAMYDKIEVGFEIPMEFFTAVAEILAYVYRLKQRTAA